MKYLLLYLLLLSWSAAYSQVFTYQDGVIQNVSQSVRELKKQSLGTIHKADLTSIDSALIKENTPLRRQFFLLAGWLNRKAALQSVPFEYRRDLRDRNDYDMAMIRAGDQSRVNRLNKLLASVKVDDEFVYTLLPKLIYTRRPEVIDFIFDQILLDRKNCSVADPHTKGRINCAYRLLEGVAPIIEKFPLRVGPSGDLDITDYPAALEIARDWIRENRSEYRIITETF